MDPNAACICVDAGEREWRYGWADDEGSQGVEVATGMAFAEAGPSEWRNSLASAFEVLEATPAEHPCLISERPGTTAEERAAMAQVLFDHFHVPAVWFVASPLAALYNAGKDTCVLVDVGERATFVLPVYCGHAAIDAATILPLGGGSLEDSGPEASCDGLFEPSVVGTGAAALCGVHEAVLRTVALCDASVRGALLGNIVLVGGGTRLRDFRSASLPSSSPHCTRPARLGRRASLRTPTGASRRGWAVLCCAACLLCTRGSFRATNLPPSRLSFTPAPPPRLPRSRRTDPRAQGAEEGRGGSTRDLPAADCGAVRISRIGRA